MKWLVLLSLFFAPFFGWAAADRAGLCFSRSNVTGTNSMSRDRSRMQCLKALGPTMTRATCLKHTRAFEYSINSEEMKAYCVFGLAGEPRPTDCLRAARSMDYGASRDDLLWSCLKKLNPTLSKVECRDLAHTMTYPAQKNRATSYCENEIKASFH